MDNSSVAVIAGGAVMLVAAAMICSHVRAWRRERDDPQLDDDERAFLARRFRRRMQTSGLLLAIGILIPVGDQLLQLEHQPALFTLYWLAILLATMWIALLAVGDMVSTRVHRRASRARLRRRRRDVREPIAGPDQSRDSNGASNRRNGAPTDIPPESVRRWSLRFRGETCGRRRGQVGRSAHNGCGSESGRPAHNGRECCGVVSRPLHMTGSANDHPVFPRTWKPATSSFRASSARGCDSPCTNTISPGGCCMPRTKSSRFF